jgi:hypothetical protein
MARGNYLGHEKEPPQPHGGKGVGKGSRRPLVHSHSARPKRSLKVGRKRR